MSDAYHLKLWIKVRASVTRIVGERNGKLEIALAAPPVDGRGNKELIRFLSKTFRLTKSAIQIVSGESSRDKVVSLDGGAIELDARLESALEDKR